MWEKLKQLARRYDEIGELLEVPEIYADPKKLRALTREQRPTARTRSARTTSCRRWSLYPIPSSRTWRRRN